MRAKVRPAARGVAPALAAARAARHLRRPVKQELPPPAPVEAQQISLMTVASSSVATSDDKSIVALVLKTEEAGPVGFQLTIEACAVLRCQIAIAQAILNPKNARADQTRGASASPTFGPAPIADEPLPPASEAALAYQCADATGG